MTKTWIVVADSAHARVFTRTGNHGPLLEQQDIVHPDSQLHDRDLASDRQGRSFDRSKGGARHSMEPATTPHGHAAETFAHEVVALLESARNSGSMDGLALIAPPHFLGLLRQGLSEPTRRLVVKEIHKDLVRHSVKEIVEHLDALPPG
jgi:protein required for attachment to host cells